CCGVLFFFSSRRRHTRSTRDWSSDVCSSDLQAGGGADLLRVAVIELEAKRQPVVPDTINGGPGGGRGKKPGAIFELVADGRRDEIGRASCRERVGGRDGTGRGER